MSNKEQSSVGVHQRVGDREIRLRRVDLPTPTPSPSSPPSRMKIAAAKRRAQTLSKEFCSKMPTPPPPPTRSLDVCLDLGEQTFMWLSIPCINTRGTLQSLSGCSSIDLIKHHHNYDEGPRPLDTNYDILTNRFPIILADYIHIKDPFPPLTPCTTFNPLVSTAVVGSTIYCLGGDKDDIEPVHLDDICDERDRSYDDYHPVDPIQHSYVPPCNNIHGHYTQLIETFFATTDPVSSAATGWEVDDDTTTTADTVPQTPPPPPPPPPPPRVRDGICHKIWTFDMRKPGLGWKQGKSLISPRIFPVLLSYQGKLYAFSGNHPSLTFAEVYDPVSDTWTQLPPAPFGRLADTEMRVVPLKGWNKLWVFSIYRHVDYTFDVLTRKWHKFKGSLDIIHLFMDKRSDLVSALTPEKHMVVYWITKKAGVYAYDLSTNQLFKGAISGTYPADPTAELIGTPFCLHHLHRDLFCLIGCDYPIDYRSFSTILHVTIIQISIKPLPKFSKARSKIHETPPNPLTAAVLACFAYPLKDDVVIHDSYLMSNIQMNKMTSGKGNA